MPPGGEKLGSQRPPAEVQVQPQPQAEIGDQRMGRALLDLQAHAARALLGEPFLVQVHVLRAGQRFDGPRLPAQGEPSAQTGQQGIAAVIAGRRAFDRPDLHGPAVLVALPAIGKGRVEVQGPGGVAAVGRAGHRVGEPDVSAALVIELRVHVAQACPRGEAPAQIAIVAQGRAIEIEVEAGVAVGAGEPSPLPEAARPQTVVRHPLRVVTPSGTASIGHALRAAAAGRYPPCSARWRAAAGSSSGC